MGDSVTTPFPYWLDHAIIAVAGQMGLFLFGLPLWIGGFIMSGFYLVREFAQYASGIRHKGRFDYEGAIAPAIATAIIALIAP
jgi:hypothetical protein